MANFDISYGKLKITEDLSNGQSGSVTAEAAANPTINSVFTFGQNGAKLNAKSVSAFSADASTLTANNVRGANTQQNLKNVSAFSADSSALTSTRVNGTNSPSVFGNGQATSGNGSKMGSIFGGGNSTMAASDSFYGDTLNLSRKQADSNDNPSIDVDPLTVKNNGKTNYRSVLNNKVDTNISKESSEISDIDSRAQSTEERSELTSMRDNTAQMDIQTLANIKAANNAKTQAQSNLTTANNNAALAQGLSTAASQTLSNAVSTQSAAQATKTAQDATVAQNTAQEKTSDAAHKSAETELAGAKAELSKAQAMPAATPAQAAAKQAAIAAAQAKVTAAEAKEKETDAKHKSDVATLEQSKRKLDVDNANLDTAKSNTSIANADNTAKKASWMDAKDVANISQQALTQAATGAAQALASTSAQQGNTVNNINQKLGEDQKAALRNVAINSLEKDSQGDASSKRKANLMAGTEMKAENAKTSNDVVSTDIDLSSVNDGLVNAQPSSLDFDNTRTSSTRSDSSVAFGELTAKKFNQELV